MKALILSADNFEDTELLVPYYRLQEAGYQVDIASHSRVPIRGKHGYEVKVDKSFEEVNPADYGLLLLPGGKAPEAIRHNIKAQAIARAFFERKKPVAAICHGPQTLISADLISGRRATCYKTVAPEMKEVNVKYEDTDVVVDGNLITSRQPDDLPAFMREVMRMLETHSSWG